MADRISKARRSRNMAAVRSRDTGPEMFLRRSLYASGVRYRVCDKRIEGRPDLYMARYRTAIFVHGCFWHRHAGCGRSVVPASNVGFWLRKFENNVARDEYVKDHLLSQGIRVIVVWECAIERMQKDPKTRQGIIERILEFLVSDEEELSIG